MSIAETLGSLFSGAPQENETFEAIRDQLARINAALQDYEAARKTNPATSELQALRQAVQEANWSPLLRIDSVIPFWSRGGFHGYRRELNDQTDELAADLEEGADLSSWPERIRALLRESERWWETAVVSRRRWRALISTVSLVTLVGGPLLVFFLFMHGEIVTERIEVTFPPGPHASKLSEDYRPLPDGMLFRSSAPEDRAAYLDAFKSFYFDGENRVFAERYLERHPEDQTEFAHRVLTREEAEGRQIQRWKVVLNNTSQRASEHISSVRATVELIQRRPFAWEDMDLQPKLVIDHANELRHLIEIRIHNLGELALALQWKLLAGPEGVVIGEGSHWKMERGESGLLPFPTWTDEWQSVGLQALPGANEQTDYRLNFDLYFALPAPPGNVPISQIETPENPGVRTYVKDQEGRFYRRMRYLRELRETARQHVIHDSNYRLVVKYEGIRGETLQTEFTGNLPKDLAWYSNKRISNQHPFENVQAKPGAAAAMKLAEPAPRLLGAIAAAFDASKATGEAGNQLTGQVRLDLSHRGDKPKAVAAHQFDDFLAPNGRISFYIDVQGVETGLYRVAVDVNGKATTRFYLESLAPSRLSFPQDMFAQWEEIKRIRRLLGKQVPEEHPLFGRLSLDPAAERWHRPEYAPAPPAEPIRAPTPVPVPAEAPAP